MRPVMAGGPARGDGTHSGKTPLARKPFYLTGWSISRRKITVDHF
jgi:hypothetical protein